MADKVAVYSGTRNVYPQMYTSLKSLLINNQMDRVYLMIEDDEFPFDIPVCVHPVNVSKQEFFKPGSPNFGSPYSYMDLLRCAIATIFQQEKIMLWLDIDTIIDDDITDLFSLNMDGYFYAGAMEPGKSKGIFTYINTGVTLCNLEHLRDWQKEIEMIAMLNCYKFNFPGQDVMNLFCQGRIRIIGSEYNGNPFVLPCTTPRIIHYAAMKSTDYMQDWAYKKYEQIELPKGDKPDA
jgi:lipopolysaccharide biosynthesis glycosyltransferase